MVDQQYGWKEPGGKEGSWFTGKMDDGLRWELQTVWRSLSLQALGQWQKLGGKSWRKDSNGDTQISSCAEKGIKDHAKWFLNNILMIQKLGNGSIITYLYDEVKAIGVLPHHSPCGLRKRLTLHIRITRSWGELRKLQISTGLWMQVLVRSQMIKLPRRVD